MCVHSHMSLHMCGEQSTASWSWFPSSTFKSYLGIEFVYSGLCAECFYLLINFPALHHI